jgi:hypothetical protein
MIEIKTLEQSERGTIGGLYVNDRFICFTLELPWEENKPNVSCVPAGEYILRWEYSAHFESNLWELKGVPGRSEVKIHVANKLSQLRGCIAVGMGIKLGDNGFFKTTSSRSALNALHDITMLGDNGKIVLSGNRATLV